MATPTKLLLVALLAASLTACDHSHEHAGPVVEEEAAPPTNRIDVPLAVRQNLGITFATVERRAVADTVRYPGAFELQSTARHQYVAPAAGRIELLVEEYEDVRPGDPLFRITSPAWQQLRKELQEALLQADAMRSQMTAHEEHRRALEDKLRFWQERLEVLNKLRETDAAQWAEISHAQQNIANTQAELADAEEKRFGMIGAAVPYLGEGGTGQSNPSFNMALNRASALLGLSEEQLLEQHDGEPRWQTIDALEVTAVTGGRVEPIPVTSGALVEAAVRVVTVTDGSQMRFRAKAMQSDLSELQEGTDVHIVPPDADAGEAVAGTLSFGLEADPAQRTVDILVELQNGQVAPWARPGIAAVAEVVVEGGGAMELAIPERAVITDGLQRVLFRRAPDNPNQVIRLQADAGVSDGKWVEILSGLAEGDEVVLGGIYELMLGSSTDGARQEGGHFHADGTFHEAH